MAKDKFNCIFCGKEYINTLQAYSCELSHNPVYVPMTSVELNNLIQFIYTKSDGLITEQLFSRLSKYLTASMKEARK